MGPPWGRARSPLITEPVSKSGQAEPSCWGRDHKELGGKKVREGRIHCTGRAGCQGIYGLVSSLSSQILLKLDLVSFFLFFVFGEGLK